MKKNLPLRLCYALLLATAAQSAFALPSMTPPLISKESRKADVKVTGNVTDDNGEPLPGVSIIVKGTSKGTSTDANGNYSITVPQNSILVFQYVGFIQQEVTVTGATNKINIKLIADKKELEEVVVIGYGSKTKKDLTGSVAAISQKDFLKGPVTSPEQLLTGKVAGVQIVSNGGSPGAGSEIIIRGTASIKANASPLFVIDGVPMENPVKSDGSPAIAGSANPLNIIDPKDIESFSILKDASAAAIYGSRASNGVILITTKKGSQDKLKMNFSTSNGVQQITKKVDVMSPDEFRNYINSNGSTAQIASMGQANTDWQNEIYKNAFISDNTFSITGGLKKLPYRASVGYLNQDGILKTDYMKRISTSLTLNPKFFDNSLAVDVNARYSNTQNNFANKDAIGAAASFDPTQSITSDDPKYAPFGGYYQWLESSGSFNRLAPANPVSLLNMKTDKSNVNRFVGNVNLNYKLPFFPDLKANLNLGLDQSNSNGDVYYSPQSGPQSYTNGENKHYDQDKTNKVFDFYLNYNKDVKSIASLIDFTAGYTYQDFYTKNGNFAKYDATNTTIIEAAPPYPDPQRSTLISFFGRLNYTFKDKYLLQTSLRADGSSRFAENNRWGYFPTVSGAWKINLENFMKDSHTFSDLKLRAGWGVTGQQDIGENYSYIPLYSLSDLTAQYQLGDTFYQMYRPGAYDPNRKWEQTDAINVGLDFGLFENRITGTIDVYNRKTKDILNRIPIPVGSNFSNELLINVGDMENKGLEFSLNTIPVMNKDLTWNLGFNFTYQKNEVTKLTQVTDPNYPGVPEGDISGGTGNKIRMISVGENIRSFYVYQQVYDSNGKPVEGAYVDRNQDGILNEKDLYHYKAAFAPFLYGMNTSLTYKKLTASMSFHGSVGNYVYNNAYSNRGIGTAILGPNYIANGSTDILFTSFTKDQYLSDYYVQNASFFRMDNLNIAYNFGKIASSRANLTVNANVQNVFVITDYKGLDPEISSGIDNNFYPRPRTFTLGVGIDF